MHIFGIAFLLYFQEAAHCGNGDLFSHLFGKNLEKKHTEKDSFLIEDSRKDLEEVLENCTMVFILKKVI